MAELVSPGLEASARLLRLVGTLALQLDPVKGIDAKTARRAAEDVDDIVEEHGTNLSSDVRQLLVSTSSSLSSSTTLTIPYSTCLSAHLALARALSLLADAPPPRSTPFSRLPAELVDRIVELCQGDDDSDMRLRQNTNLALASTCRAFHRSAQPILRREVHLFTPGQLERFGEVVHHDRRDLAAVKILSTDLVLADVCLQADGRWPGWNFDPIVRALTSLEVLIVDFQLSASAEPANWWNDDEVGQALGLGRGTWPTLYSTPTLRRLRLPIYAPHHFSTEYEALVRSPPVALAHLEVGRSDHPLHLEWEGDLRHSQSRPPTHFYRHLALPWVPIDVPQLLNHVCSPAGVPSHVEHLETYLRLDSDSFNSVAELEMLFVVLAPSLRSLVIRLDTDQDWDWQAKQDVTNALFRGLSRCSKLKHLELGATERCLWTDFPINLSEIHPPHLDSLVILVPHAFCTLVDYAMARPRSMRAATACLPEPSQWLDREDGDMESTQGVMETCAGHDLRLTLSVRPAEMEWWAQLVEGDE